MTDLTAQTPPQIDAQIFELQQAAWAAADRAETQVLRLHQILDTKVRDGRWGVSRWAMTDNEVLDAAEIPAVGDSRIANALAAWTEAKADRSKAYEAMQPFTEEFNRRSGWTRAYIVANADGHVHNTTNCSSWRMTTRYHWATELSGQSEQEIVEQAGGGACTKCYRSAPVNAFKSTRTLFSPDQKAEQERLAKAREERAAAKAAKDAKKLFHPVTGEVLRSITENIKTGELRDGQEIGKTERGAMNEAIRGLNSYLFYGEDHPSAQAWMATADLVAAALVAKNGGEYKAVREDLNARALKSYKRETGRTQGKSAFPAVNV